MQSGAQTSTYRIRGTIGALFFGSSPEISERYMRMFMKLGLVSYSERTMSSRLDYGWSMATGGIGDATGGLVYIASEESDALHQALLASTRRVTGPIIR